MNTSEAIKVILFLSLALATVIFMASLAMSDMNKRLHFPDSPPFIAVEKAVTKSFGGTIYRIKWSNATGDCEWFIHGEADFYCVNIGNSRNNIYEVKK